MRSFSAILISRSNRKDSCGNEWQKQQLLPQMTNLAKIGGFALTEKNVGSDASNLETTCTRISDDTWRIDGNKRWIGNANRDVVVLWAKSVHTGRTNGFILELIDGTPGLVRRKLHRKASMRGVSNMELQFDGLLIHEKWRLSEVSGFGSVAQILGHSRQFVGWVLVGIGLGLYERVLRYVRTRRQFGKRLAQFQLVQQKLVKIMANVQASMQLMAQVSRAYDQGKSSMAQLSLAKAWVSAVIRQTAALARELLGGNGILLDNYVIKAMVDIEAAYTYEGTYDINALITARELTGYQAFK